ncbi:MAG: hypothetical protein M3421_01340 [Bacteroidota bacterium]|jgi:hypothetical protein|nr:hypothetical protein [Bacteroidota bacterium]
MKTSAIKKLVETQPLRSLIEAEHALIEDKPLLIDVEGDDEGEKLTHIIAAVWILERMRGTDVEFKTALNEYTQKVRESIN